MEQLPVNPRLLINGENKKLSEEELKWIDSLGDNPGKPGNKLIFTILAQNTHTETRVQMSSGIESIKRVGPASTPIPTHYHNTLPEKFVKHGSKSDNPVHVSVQLFESVRPNNLNPALPPEYLPLNIFIPKYGDIRVPSTNSNLCWFLLCNPHLFDGKFQNKHLTPMFAFYNKESINKKSINTLAAKRNLFIEIEKMEATRKRAVAVEIHNTENCPLAHKFHNPEAMTDLDIAAELDRLSDAQPVELAAFIIKPNVDAQTLRQQLLEANLIEEKQARTYKNVNGKLTQLFTHTAGKSPAESWVIWFENKSKSALEINELSIALAALETVV